MRGLGCGSSSLAVAEVVLSKRCRQSWRCCDNIARQQHLCIKRQPFHCICFSAGACLRGMGPTQRCLPQQRNPQAVCLCPAAVHRLPAHARRACRWASLCSCKDGSACAQVAGLVCGWAPSSMVQLPVRTSAASLQPLSRNAHRRWCRVMWLRPTSRHCCWTPLTSSQRARVSCFLSTCRAVMSWRMCHSASLLVQLPRPNTYSPPRASAWEN